MKNFQPATLTGGKLKTASRIKAIEKGLEHLRAGIDMSRVPRASFYPQSRLNLIELRIVSHHITQLGSLTLTLRF